MQSVIITSILAFLASSAIAAPLPDRSSYQITNFGETKSPDNDITSVFFDVTAWDPATSKPTGPTTHCTPFDPVTKQSVENWEDGKVYKCAATSIFSFSYSEKEGPLKGRLYMWQEKTADAPPRWAFTPIQTPECHTADKDQICSAPDALITLTNDGT